VQNYHCGHLHDSWVRELQNSTLHCCCNSEFVYDRSFELGIHTFEFLVDTTTSSMDGGNLNWGIDFRNKELNHNGFDNLRDH
jgi:hypothetical protein